MLNNPERTFCTRTKKETYLLKLWQRRESWLRICCGGALEASTEVKKNVTSNFSHRIQRLQRIASSVNGLGHKRVVKGGGATTIQSRFREIQPISAQKRGIKAEEQSEFAPFQNRVLDRDFTDLPARLIHGPSEIEENDFQNIFWLV